MIRYTVIWDSEARESLATIWIQAVNRKSVSDAANQIDQDLAWDPAEKGHTLDDERVLSVPPLAVTFTVDQGNRIVFVLQVWYRAARES